MQQQLEKVGNAKKPAAIQLKSEPQTQTTLLEKVILPAKRLLKNFKKDSAIELPTQETILETFQRDDIGGRLLILGKPGSGKTMTLLTLAQSLLDQCQTTGQVLYIFELSAWKNDQQPIDKWLIEQLKLVHNIPEAVTTGWLKQGKFIPLLRWVRRIGANPTSALCSTH